MGRRSGTFRINSIAMPSNISICQVVCCFTPLLSSSSAFRVETSISNLSFTCFTCMGNH